MTSGMSPEMLEAARLTRQGKLAEATAIIQRLLQDRQRANPEKGAAPAIPDAALATTDAGHAAAYIQPDGSQPDAPFTPRRALRPRTGLRETVNRLVTVAKTLGVNNLPARRPVPGPVPDGASFTASTYSNAAGTRSYKLYVPSARTGAPLPLIVMLHGCTQSADDFAAGTQMNVLAEKHGFLAAYPEQHFSANTKLCWNWFKADDQCRDYGEPSLIAGITTQIMRDHNVDPARVYIAGLSAGGAAAAIMSDTYPDLYAAAGVHSGLPAGAASDLPSAFDAMRIGAAAKKRNPRLIPTIVFHGGKDIIVHPRNGDAVAAQALGMATGLRHTLEHGRVPDGHAYSRMIYADPEGRTICEHWRIHEAGHAWAGGSPAGSHSDPHGPDASKEMVRFFFEHRAGK